MKRTEFNQVKTAGGPAQAPSGGDKPSLSSALRLMKDIYSGVYGILRKRSKYRCLKRGEDFVAYDEAVRAVQRKIKDPVLAKTMRDMVYAENPFLSMVSKTDAFGGVYIKLPEPWPFGYRKRARFRHKDYVREKITTCSNPESPS